jgi:hypothetical protein
MLNVKVAGEIDLNISELTAPDGSLLVRGVEPLAPQEAQLLRAAARLLRARRFRMTVRCDACFEAGRGDGMRGEITASHIVLDCRCRTLKYQGQTL